MSNFKETVANDINTFIDVDFFGVDAVVEGKKIFIVIDNDELKNRQGGQDLAVAESSTLFYARSDDLPKRRPPGENININGRECIIDDWKDDMGVSTIALRENIIM